MIEIVGIFLGVEAIEALYAIAVAVVLYSLSDEIVPLLSTAARELDSITVTLPEVKRGEIGIPIGLSATLGMIGAGIVLAKSSNSLKSNNPEADNTSKENSKNNKEKTGNETEPRENHEKQPNGRQNPDGQSKGKGPKNGSSDSFDKNGEIKQRRYYDEEGNPQKDIDYTDHGNPKNHKKPHDHYWGKNDNGINIRYT